MPSMDSLDTLLQEELKDIYDAEKQLTKAIPKLVKKASASELKEALQTHLRETEQQVERLEQVFELLGMPARGKKCTGMQNLLREGAEMMSEAEDEATRDAVMIAAAQKVEHYEIASYGTMQTWANRLGKRDIAGLLEDTLEEEKEADQKLTMVAESLVNPRAAHGEDEEEARPARGASMARASRSAAADRSTRAASNRRRSR